MDADTVLVAVPMDVVGSHARIEALFDAHHERLYRLARRLSPTIDDAKDLVQETYLRAAQKLSSVPPTPADEQAWLVRVLVNICRDRWRRDEVRRRFQPHRAAALESGEGAIIAKSTIWRALQNLSPRRRAVLIMSGLEDMPIPAIARTLGVANVTVRWHLSKGRRELANFINPKGSSHEQ